jgi:hypothetical protein
METQALVNSSNQESVNFISLEEAGQQLNMSYSTLSKWLTSHKDIKDKYCFKAKYQGRKRTLIYIEGLAVILNVKDTGRNVSEGKKELNSKIPEVKEQLAEKAIEQVKSSQSLESLYSQAQMMVKTLEQLMNVSGQVQNHEERLLTLEGDTENLVMTNGQRERLNERLRFFCSQTGVGHALVWRDLHDITGRKSINEYVFADYKVALSRLREIYKLKNIQW